MTEVTRNTRNVHSEGLEVTQPLKDRTLSTSRLNIDDGNILEKIMYSATRQTTATGVRQVSILPNKQWEKTSVVGTAILGVRVEPARLRREIKCDGNNGLRAIVRSLNPDIVLQVEDTVSTMLRGDMILHIKNNLMTYTKYFDDTTMKDQGHLNETLTAHCTRMANSEERIGMFELIVLSDLLKTSIHLHSDDNSETIIGKEYAKSDRQPIHLYIDSTTLFFDALI